MSVLSVGNHPSDYTVQQPKKYDKIRHYFVPSVGNHPSDYTVQQLKKYDIIRHYFVPSVGNHPSDYNAQYLKEHNIIIIEVQTCDICTLRAYICTHIRVEIKKYI